MGFQKLICQFKWMDAFFDVSYQRWFLWWQKLKFSFDNNMKNWEGLSVGAVYGKNFDVPYHTFFILDERLMVAFANPVL